MPLTLSSMFQALTQLLQCNRRVPKSTAIAKSESNVKFHNEPTKVRNYNEPSDASTTDDASDRHGTYQSEDSEQTDCPTTYLRAPPGLAPPPGLDLKAPAGQPKWATHQRAEGPAPRNAPWRTEQGRHQKQAADDTFAALKEALANLAPTEIAAVRGLLDAKARSAGAGAPSRNSGWATSNNPVGSGRPQRPWTPSGANINRKPEMDDVDTGENLQTFLRDLGLLNDDSRVVSVRKIAALGFDSAPILQDYFSQFGTVDRVMVAPSVVKSKASFGKSRARPAGLGFVVMRTTKEVEAILKHGETHNLAGVDLKAGPFQSHSVDGTD